MWKGQFVIVFTSHSLISHINDDAIVPEKMTTAENGSSSCNPLYTAWLDKDQKVLSLIYALLSEETMAEAIGCATARSAWLALE
ncbi:hypothetical protein ACS0TY_030111 [Phlomoides rotata]